MICVGLYYDLMENNMTGTKLTLFADDATFTLKDMCSLEKCLSILHSFGKMSSSKLNVKKSGVGWIGTEKDTCLLPPDIKVSV